MHEKALKTGHRKQANELFVQFWSVFWVGVRLYLVVIIWYICSYLSEFIQSYSILPTNLWLRISVRVRTDIGKANLQLFEPFNNFLLFGRCLFQSYFSLLLSILELRNYNSAKFYEIVNKIFHFNHPLFFRCSFAPPKFTPSLSLVR